MKKKISFALVCLTIVPMQIFGVVSNTDNYSINNSRTGFEVNSAYSFTTLEEAIAKATALLNSTTEGTAEGEFPAGSKADLQTALDSAIAFLGTDTTQSRIDSEISELYDACSTYESLVFTTPVNLVDTKANKQTRYLYLNLKNQMNRALMFGMYEATGYGVGWSNDDDRSDVKDVCGDFPAVYEEDLRNIIQGSTRNKDDDRFRYRIISAYQRGAVISIAWHQYDPDNRHYYASEINNEKIVSQILPGGARHADYTARLRKAAEFFKSLRGENGEGIPIIFRPYHEHMGGWFWWGVGHCTTAEYNELWQFTFRYLHNNLNVHNLLWAISPNLEHVNDDDEYFERFPGNAYVDIYGTDFYHHSPVPPATVTDYTNDLQTVVQHALDNNKIPALTEMGQEGLDDINWHTRMMINPVKHDSINNSIAYAVTWRNANETHFHAPYPGHPSVPDFLDFYNDPYTLFESDLPDMYALPAADLSAPLFTKYPQEQLVSPTTSAEIKIETDERASLRWSYTDEEYDQMPNPFELGQRMYAHTTFIETVQGIEKLIYVQAMDVYGNKTSQSIPLSFTVDTLQAKIVWYNMKYSVNNWNQDTASFGIDFDAETSINDVKTAYFIKDFEMTEKPNAARVLIQLNGGFAVYINGCEVARYRLPEEIELNYDTPPLSTARTAKAVDFTSEHVEYLVAGINRIAIEVHGGEPGVEFFDALFQTDIEAPFYYGSDWSFYDLGDMPETYTLGEVLSVDVVDNIIPKVTRLYQNYPNPFNPLTKIKFDIKNAGPVTIEIYNILGQKIGTLLNDDKKPGVYEVTFDSSNLASGIYTYVLTTKSAIEKKENGINKIAMHFKNSKRKFFPPLALFFASLILSFCSSENKEIVAEFGEQNITLQEFRIAYLDVIKKPDTFDSPKLREKFLDELITSRLLAKEAENQGYYNEKLLYKINAYKNKALREAHFEAVIKPEFSITEEDIQDAYVFTQEQRKISHLFADTKLEIDSVYALLKNGKSFEEIASNLFNNTSLANNGGDLGWVHWDELEYDLAMKAFQLPTDSLSVPVKSQFGYHILKVTDFKKKPLITRQEYEVYKQKAKSLLEYKLGDKYANEYINEMIKKVEIKIDARIATKVRSKLKGIIKRQPDQYNPMSEMQLTNDEVRLMEKNLWEMKDDKFAVINGKTYTVAEFLGALNFIPYNIIYSSFKKSINYAIRDFIIEQEALRLGLDTEDKVVDKTNLYKEYLLQSELRQSLLKKTVVTEKEKAKYYQKNKSKFKNAEDSQAKQVIEKILKRKKRSEIIPNYISQLLGNNSVRKNIDIIHNYYDSVLNKNQEE